MQRAVRTSGALVSFVLGLSAAHAADDFPHRAEFPDVKTISTEELAAQYDRDIIIDVRSDFEYDVIHINKAVNLPLARADFLDTVAKVRPRNDKTPLVFYCNGHTCKKSYEAAQATKQGGFTNVYAYDSGIFGWVHAHPAKGTLLGKTPADPTLLISKEKLQAHTLVYAEFAKKAELANAWVIDLREPMQREKVAAFANVRNFYGAGLHKRIDGGAFKDKLPLFFDAVGKQVQWLQYHLEEAGIHEYYFLDGGATSLP